MQIAMGLYNLTQQNAMDHLGVRYLYVEASTPLEGQGGRQGRARRGRG